MRPIVRKARTLAGGYSCSGAHYDEYGWVYRQTYDALSRVTSRTEASSAD